MDGKNASKQFLQITTETKEIGVFGKMEQRYYQKEIETMPLEDMKALQSERLVAQVKHVYENVPYYRKKMDSSKLSKKDNKKQKQNNKENYPSSPRNQKGNNAITQYGKDIPIKNAQTVMIQNGIEVSTKETNQILSRDDGDSNSKKVTLLEKIKPKDKRFSMQTLAKSNRLGSLVKSAMTQNEKSKY